MHVYMCLFLFLNIFFIGQSIKGAVASGSSFGMRWLEPARLCFDALAHKGHLRQNGTTATNGRRVASHVPGLLPVQSRT